MSAIREIPTRGDGRLRIAFMFAAPLTMIGNDAQQIPLRTFNPIDELSLLRDTARSAAANPTPRIPRCVQITDAVATTQQLQTAITIGRDVLHLSVLGSVNQTHVALEDGRGGMHQISQEQLRALLRGPSGLTAGVSVVVLTSNDNEVFAQMFVNAGVPHVVHVQRGNNTGGKLDTKTQTFLRSLYTSIIYDEPLDEAFISAQTAALSITTSQKGGNTPTVSFQCSLLPHTGIKDQHHIRFATTKYRAINSTEEQHMPEVECLELPSANLVRSSCFVSRTMAVQNVYNVLVNGQGMTGSAPLLTLVGPPGIGKTEIAMSACEYAQQRRRFSRLFFVKCTDYVPAARELFHQNVLHGSVSIGTSHCLNAIDFLGYALGIPELLDTCLEHAYTDNMQQAQGNVANTDDNETIENSPSTFTGSVLDRFVMLVGNKPSADKGSEIAHDGSEHSTTPAHVCSFLVNESVACIRATWPHGEHVLLTLDNFGALQVLNPEIAALLHALQTHFLQLSILITSTCSVSSILNSARDMRNTSVDANINHGQGGAALQETLIHVQGLSPANAAAVLAAVAPELRTLAPWIADQGPEDDIDILDVKGGNHIPEMPMLGDSDCNRYIGNHIPETSLHGVFSILAKPEGWQRALASSAQLSSIFNHGSPGALRRLGEHVHSVLGATSAGHIPETSSETGGSSESANARAAMSAFELRAMNSYIEWGLRRETYVISRDAIMPDPGIISAHPSFNSVARILKDGLVGARLPEAHYLYADVDSRQGATLWLYCAAYSPVTRSAEDMQTYESITRSAMAELVHLCVAPWALTIPERELVRQVRQFLHTASISPWQKGSSGTSLKRFANVFWPWWCACTRVIEWLGGVEVLLPAAMGEQEGTGCLHSPLVFQGFITGLAAKQCLANSNCAVGNFIVRLSESRAGHLAVEYKAPWSGYVENMLVLVRDRNANTDSANNGSISTVKCDAGVLDVTVQAAADGSMSLRTFDSLYDLLLDSEIQGLHSVHPDAPKAATVEPMRLAHRQRLQVNNTKHNNK